MSDTERDESGPGRGAMPIMEFLAIDVHVASAAGRYEAAMVAAPNTLNANGVVHGAALAALIDHAGGYGAQQLLQRRGVTSDLHIRYLSAARAGTTLTASARVVRAGRTQIVMDVEVTDDQGRVVAAADMALATADGAPAS
jgi:acyl-coenzyme A thioesterase 13